MPIKSKQSDEFDSRDLPRRNASRFPEDDKLVIRSIRLHASRATALERHFKSRGANLTTGIRQVLYDWMDAEDIH